MRPKSDFYIQLASTLQPRFQKFPSDHKASELCRIVSTARSSANDGAYTAVLQACVPGGSLVYPGPIVLPSVRSREIPGVCLNRLSQFARARLKSIASSAWSGLKLLGRRLVHWFARRVVMPLAFLASIWVPAVNPAEIPL